MTTSTIIEAHEKSIKVLQLIDRANIYIQSSEKHATSTSAHLQPIIEFHKKNVERYTKIADRLQGTYSNIKYKIQQMHANVYGSEMMLPF